MGFKVDTSFLKYLTMGARGALQVMDEMSNLGFRPVELERYCTSNKIWSTKVKRLRMPDLLCVRTGLRVEVRAKSDLKIRMSDAPNDPNRTWDAGAKSDDVIAFIACREEQMGAVPAERAVYFEVRALQRAVGSSRLGPPKSASEGAERDRTWPSSVPSRSGVVQAVDRTKVVVLMDGAEGVVPRRQTYSLNGKSPYVRVGDRFEGGASIIAGTPEALADLNSHLGKVYDPIAQLENLDPVERYAAAKAIRFRPDLHMRAPECLLRALENESEMRTALEMAGTLAALGIEEGRARLVNVLHDGDPYYLRMEAIFILTEISDAFAREQLTRVANDTSIVGDERRQAALWGLGKSGMKDYEALIPHIADPEDNVAFHAIVGFGSDTPEAVIHRLVDCLIEGDDRLAPAASEALRMVEPEIALEALIRARDSQGYHPWLVTTIGRLDPSLVRRRLEGAPIMRQLEPMLLLADGANWLSSNVARNDVTFLAKQG